MAHRVTMSPPYPRAQTPSRSLQRKVAQFDAHHTGPDKVKRQLIEDLAVVRLRSLISQEAEADQTKAQEVAPKKVIEVPSADDD